MFVFFEKKWKYILILNIVNEYKTLKMKRICIFASGNGTNTKNIIDYFKQRKNCEVSLVLSNKKEAYVLQRAQLLGVSNRFFSREDLHNYTVLKLLEEYRIDFIVLAGFLWLIPKELLRAYPNRIVNIHPALLPKYGGKGMYGARVHETVLENKEKESGISIHYVNEEYDKGDIIFQARCKVEQGETADSLAKKVHKLEYEHFPRVIEKLMDSI